MKTITLQFASGVFLNTKTFQVLKKFTQLQNNFKHKNFKRNF